ncbi:MAG: hypothetical protein Q7K29_08730 [Thermoleophilia bacterium]|nr:hypothetical protein [Thermoleophilia bacterium]
MLLIVDRQMPYLRRRCEEISCQNPELQVVVDRRITQDPHDVPNRRVMLEKEEMQ